MKNDISEAGIPQSHRFQRSLSSRLTARFTQCLAVVGAAAILSQSWSALDRVLAWQHLARQSTITDVFPDTNYPLRPALEPWDISTSYPYPRNWTANVTEGTWLRLAVHPLYDEVVFDMLGDLYCMSTDVSGKPSDARAFLRGVPFDKEAEFFKDGSNIVFISDAGFGVDNVWTLPYTNCDAMSVVPSEEIRRSAIQQTNSTFRFFSSPSFHPTEPMIVATKWFLTGRPNGVGEMWELPLHDLPAKYLPERSGTRLVGRKLPASWPISRYGESQLGAEQACYHPVDGDIILYTRNVKDNDFGKFSYNKDVHSGVNAVFQMNITSGIVTELVSAAASSPNRPASPGGASMPRLSPDGMTLAFVRRMDDKSVLALKDMRSGTLYYAWDGLMYDVSMIPAFMGAYPNYGWARNGSAIIIWSQGHVWSIPLKLNSLGERVSNGVPRVLPFEAKIELALGSTRYSATNITAAERSSEGHVTALSRLRSDHSGDNVVFEAAGDTHHYNMASASLTNLGKPNIDTSCYDPSFIHETSLLLHACWDDRNLTSFWLHDTLTGDISLVVGLPRGKYVSPVARNGSIAFVRTGKDYMLGDIEETFQEGVWIGKLAVSPSGGEALISDLSLAHPIRSDQETKLDIIRKDSSNILLMQNQQSVAQCDLIDNECKMLFDGKSSVEMAASYSKHSWAVAYRDFQHVWLWPQAVEPAKPLWSKPGDTRTPQSLVRLSDFGGHDVALSGDGKKVFWLLGPIFILCRSTQSSKPAQMQVLKAGITAVALNAAFLPKISKSTTRRH